MFLMASMVSKSLCLIVLMSARNIRRVPGATLHDLLRTRDLQSSYVRRLMNAAYLAPAIKQAIFQGTQPSELQVQDLIKPRSMDWNVQMEELGFVEPATSASH